MSMRFLRFVLAPIAIGSASLHAQTIRAELSYRAPVDGQPKPNFSPKGTQIALTAVATDAVLPQGAARPAKTGVVKVGADSSAWVRVLIAADSANARDLTRLYVDRNRNGDFTDDGPPVSGVPAQNEKTKAWWTSINKVELSVPYAETKATEPYLVNFWIVRDDSTPPPDVMRYSVASWRAGMAKVNGLDAHVAVMDDNDAIFSRNDMWSAMAVADSAADKRVLTIAEARATTRLMFVTGEGRDIPVEFKSISPDGRWIEFAVLDQPITKAADRAPDDMLREERSRPRATVPFAWGHGQKDFTGALAAARKSGKKVILDFEATWCGPCHTMDQWVWNDAEVAGALNAGFVGVKIDVDLEKALVARYKTKGYPTMIVLDSKGKEIQRVADYQSSKEMLAFLRGKP